jgi:AcrR family transcriptional regulator
MQTLYDMPAQISGSTGYYHSSSVTALRIHHPPPSLIKRLINTISEDTMFRKNGGSPMAGRSKTSLETRNKLLRAARDLLTENGWHKLTNRAISERAGVNLALISYHFDGKKGLLRELLNNAVTETVARYSPAGKQSTPGEFLHDAAEAIIQIHQDPNARVVVAAMLEGAQDDDFRPAVFHNLDRLRQHLHSALEARGTPSDQISGLVTLLAAALDGLLIHLILDPATDVRGAADALLAINWP